MELVDLLTPGAIRVCNGVRSKKRLFQDIAETAAAAHGIDVSTAIDALQERESLGATGVGHGVALPHARLDGIEHVRGVFIRLDRPLDYGSVDRAPVDLVFALIAPRDNGVEHLKALALVSRTLRDGAVCAKLRANEDTDKLYSILCEQLDSRVA